MAAELEQERLDLLTRLGALETNHMRLKSHPHDREGHKQHHAELAAYQSDVRAYRLKATEARRELGLPDPPLDFRR
jgi:hypothetical protein